MCCIKSKLGNVDKMGWCVQKYKMKIRGNNYKIHLVTKSTDDVANAFYTVVI